VNRVKGGAHPKYNRAIVGQVLLMQILNKHPTCMTVAELVDRTIADSGDASEVETARAAIRELRQTGLIRYCDDDELVEPTQAALHAHTLSSTL
jgi:hypothetical protein